jgi:hypothetical protein
MTTVDQIDSAIGWVESRNDPPALPDGGRALGRWQVHPDRLWSEAHAFKLSPALGETWDSFVDRVLRAMITYHAQHNTPLEIAMYWHLGHWADPDDADWDQVYADKFSLQFARLGQGAS